MEIFNVNLNAVNYENESEERIAKAFAGSLLAISRNLGVAMSTVCWNLGINIALARQFVLGDMSALKISEVICALEFAELYTIRAA